MPTLDESASAMAEILLASYGRASPHFRGLDPFPALIGAYLGRSMSFPEAEASVVRLRDAGLAEPDALAQAEPSEVAELLRRGGLATVRLVGPLLRLARWVADQGSVETILERSTEVLREELVSINGIGLATADAILLHGLDRPVYPLDRASYRILVRHGWLDPTSDEAEARSTLERLAPGDAAGLANWSAWLDRIGREFCRAGRPKCEGCPLRPFLPERGPIEPDG